jgi:hypothetical protein
LITKEAMPMAVMTIFFIGLLIWGVLHCIDDSRF